MAVKNIKSLETWAEMTPKARAEKLMRRTQGKVRTATMKRGLCLMDCKAIVKAGDEYFDSGNPNKPAHKSCVERALQSKPMPSAMPPSGSVPIEFQNVSDLAGNEKVGFEEFERVIAAYKAGLDAAVEIMRSRQG